MLFQNHLIILCVVAVFFLGILGVITPVDGTLCFTTISPRMFEDYRSSEYAIVTITITDIDQSESRVGKVSYNIDDIKYLENAKSNIHATNGSFQSYWSSITEKLEIGQQYVIAYSKQNQSDWHPFISCDAIYHKNILGYLEWYESIGHTIDDKKTHFYKFKITSFQAFKSPISKIEYKDRLFIGSLDNVLTVQKNSTGHNILPKHILTFDVVHDYYNTDAKEVVLDYPAWTYNNDVMIPTEDELYFIHLRDSKSMGESTERIRTLVSLDDSHTFVKEFFSTDNQAQVYFYEEVHPKIVQLSEDIKNNKILKSKIYALADQGFPLSVRIIQMDLKILQEWNILFKKYELENESIKYKIYDKVSDFGVRNSADSDIVTWRDLMAPPVKEQLRWDVRPFNIDCGKVLSLVILADGTPECVLESDVQKMFDDNSAVMQVRPTLILNLKN